MVWAELRVSLERRTDTEAQVRCTVQTSPSYSLSMSDCDTLAFLLQRLAQAGRIAEDVLMEHTILREVYDVSGSH
jgi:hypothetical protein